MTSASWPVRRRCSSTRSTGIGDSVDVGKERFGDNCDAHDRQRGAVIVAQVADNGTGHEKLVCGVGCVWRRVCGAGCAASGVRRSVPTMRTPEMRPPDIRLWSMRVIGCALAVIALTTGCTRDISGTAQPDPHGPATKLTEDGYGISPETPRLPSNWNFYRASVHTLRRPAERLRQRHRRYMTQGRLAITYRPLTFLDPEHDGDSGDHGAATRPASAIRCSWPPGRKHQPGCSSCSSKTCVVASRARRKRPQRQRDRRSGPESGVPGDAVEKMKSGTSAVNIADMA